MANLGDMVVRIVGENSTFDTSIDRSNKKLESFGKSAIKVGQSLSLWVTTPIVGLGVAAVASSAKMEALEASFSTLLGSVSQAKSLMKELIDFADKTPFEATGLAQTTKVLLSLGVESQNVMGILKTLGDVAGGNQDKLNSLGLALGQVRSAGKLMGQELLQMINAGFSPLQEISRTTGESTDSLRQKMEKGLITFDMVKTAFETSTQAGGRFKDGMLVASKTFEGLSSTLADDVSAMGRSFSEEFMPSLKETIKGLSGAAQWLTKTDSTTKVMITTTLAFAAAMGPLALGIGGVSLALKALATSNPWILGISAGVAGIVALTVGISGAIESSKRLGGNFNEIMNAMKFLGPGDDVAKTVGILSEKYGVLKKDILEAAISSGNMGKQAKSNAIAVLDGILLDERANGVKAAEIDKQRAANEAKEKANFIASQARSQLAEENKLAATSNEYRKRELELASELAAKKKEYADKGVVTGQEIIDLEARYAKDAVKIKEEEAAEKQKLIEETAKKEEDAQNEKFDSLINFAKIFTEIGQDSVQVTEKTEDEKRKEYEQTLRTIQSTVSSIADIFQGFSNNQLETIKQESDAKLKANSVEMEAELVKAGVQEKTALETAQAKVDEAKKSGDAIKIKEAQDALIRTQIEQRYEEKSVEIKKETAKKTYAIQLAQFNANKTMSLINIAISTAEGIAKAVGMTGPLAPFAIPIVAGLGLSQAAIVLGQPAPPPPALAEGGIVMPRAGGVMAQIAEAGQPEVVFPLDKLNQFIGGGNGGSDGWVTHITVNLDSKPFLDKIFPATKNRQVLISQGALV